MTTVKTFGSVTRTYYKSLWSFRETTAATRVGTLNAAETEADAVHITAHRSDNASYFSSELDDAVKLKPRFLILSAWNEFGSTGDEPSPEGSWTIMPNTKFGRRYTEILREKVIQYKSP